MLTSAFPRLLKVSFASFLRPAFMSGVVLTTALNAGGAFALDFNFTFSGGPGSGYPAAPASVSGLISGLVDNMNDQTSGITVTITSATNTPPAGWPAFSTYIAGEGFDVSAGAITGVNIKFTDGGSTLYLGNQGAFSPELRVDDYSYTNYSTSETLNFTPLPPPCCGTRAPAPSGRSLCFPCKSPTAASVQSHRVIAGPGCPAEPLPVMGEGLVTSSWVADPPPPQSIPCWGDGWLRQSPPTCDRH
jgi:hypothetical protein